MPGVFFVTTTRHSHLVDVLGNTNQRSDCTTFRNQFLYCKIEIVTCWLVICLPKAGQESPFKATLSFNNRLE
jgi:hypothetical protein